jgi:hypothetical protein
VTIDSAVDNASGDWRSGATVGNSASQPQYNSSAYTSSGPVETTDVTQPQYTSADTSAVDQSGYDRGIINNNNPTTTDTSVPINYDQSGYEQGLNSSNTTTTTTTGNNNNNNRQGLAGRE